MYRLLAAVGIVLAFSTAAFAAEYYVSQNPETKKCSISKTKPDGKTALMIGAGSYKTKDEAKSARRAAAECPGAPPKTK
jgi:hypothetical protein